MMLTRLVLRNFQNHKNRTLKLGRVTTLVGPTDCGKSAVLRALRWLCSNQPTGDQFVTHTETDCEVLLEADGRTVKRGRGKSNNYYELDGRVFHAFGTDVPLEIREFLKVSELNFQRQLDPPFWLSLSAAEAARRLNAVVDLSLVDLSLQKINAEVRRANADLESCLQRESEARQEVDRLSFVPELLVAAGEAFTLEAKITGLKKSRQRLDSSLAEIRILVTATSAGAPDLSAPDGIALELQRKKKQRETLCLLLERARRLRRESDDVNERARRSQEELSGLASLCPTCGRPIG